VDFTKELQPFVMVKDVEINAPLINNPSIVGMVMGVIREKVGHDEWCLEDDFTNDIGFDSLEFVELIFDIEEVLNGN
jgi:hypothetical protein